jgi:DHA2 family methylenomycin A resistance protein-like MFS transporter
MERALIVSVLLLAVGAVMAWRNLGQAAETIFQGRAASTATRFYDAER